MPLRRLLRHATAASLAVLSFGFGPMAAAMMNGDHRPRPIDIVERSSAAESAPSISVRYAASVTVGIVNLTRNPQGSAHDWGSIKVKVPEGSQVEVNGQRFRLLQFHFNTPTEETLERSRPDMVVHFVHVRDGAGVCDQNALLVIGARIREGEAHAELGKIASLAHEAPIGADGLVSILDFRLDAVLPSVKTGWRYPGAGASPETCRTDHPGQALLDQVDSDIFPGSVSWVVLQEPIMMSRNQIDQVREQLDRNLLATKRPSEPKASHSGD